LKKAIHIILFLSLNIGFMLYARSVTNAEKDTWIENGLTVAGWIDAFWLPLTVLALGNFAIYWLFDRGES